MIRSKLAPVVSLAAFLAPALHAGSADATEFFEAKIRPILANNCFACHNPKLKSGGLDLSTAAGFSAGGAGGPLVAKGEPSRSRLIQVLSYQETTRMPPTGKLKDQQIADMLTWVNAGAPWPENVQTGAIAPRSFWAFQPVKDYPVPEIRNRLWAKNQVDHFILAKLEEKRIAPAPAAGKLTLLRRATFDLTGLPPTQKEIDEFLADSSPDAFPRVVDRLLASPRYGERWGRHWLDVARYADSTGADEDIRYPYAYRFRDYVIDSFNRDVPYNQFVTEQLAGDLLPAKPGEVNERGIVATGFVALGLKLLAEQDKPKMVYDMVDEQIDTTSRAFMGLTVACARCHDHKFDPIPTKDYYSMASIFASTKSLSKVEGTVSQLYFAPLVPSEVFARYQEHQNKIKDKSGEIQQVITEEAMRYAAALRPHLASYMMAAFDYERRPKSMQNMCAGDFARSRKLDEYVFERWEAYLKPSGDVRPHLDRWVTATQQGRDAAGQVANVYQTEFEKTAAEWEQKLTEWNRKVAEAVAAGKQLPEKPEFEAGEHVFFADVMFDKRGAFNLPQNNEDTLFSPQSREKLKALRASLEALKKSSPSQPPMACAVTEGPSVEQHVFIRGNTASPGELAPKRFLQVIAGENQKPIERGSGRLELAQWLTDPSHPLTARVMVNRIWQYHFGEGLVRTPNNFGKLGEQPTHPELLDYLAKRFVGSGWSMKSMHRLLMLSSAYQMSSQITKQQIEADPSNRLFSHFNRRRLDVEEIRDALLVLDGSLDAAMGGALEIKFGTDGENAEGRLSVDPARSKRRTVYLPIRRSNLPSLFNLFDFGDATTPSEGRAMTNVAPQALFMMNSRFIAERARGLAKKLTAASADPPERIQQAYVETLARRPDPEEAQELLQYIKSFEKKAADSGAPAQDAAGQAPISGAWQSLCRILIASNEFLYVD